MKHRLALLQDAKAFAKAKLADGWNVSAGTLNPHRPKRTIALAPMLDWLDEPDEDGSQTFREPNDRRTTPSPLPCKTRCEARLDGVGRHTKRPAKCLGQMVVELPEDQARAIRDELTNQYIAKG